MYSGTLRKGYFVMKFRKFYIILLSSCFVLSSLNAYCQLTVTPSMTAAVLAAKLAGPGITITAATLTCAAVANGTFVSVATPLTIDSGIILTTGRAIQAAGAASFLASTSNGTAGDPALTALAGATTYDACTLQFDFIPNGDTVSFNYQFGSEEYNNSTCGPYNDAFAFFISGPGIVGTQNMALVPGTTIPVTVNSINSGIPGSPAAPYFCNIANCNIMGPGSPFTAYYYDNTGGTQLTYKGFTKKLAAVHSVIPCNTYHLKLSICDAGNALYDSGVFIEAGSLKTNNFHFDHVDSIGHTINGVPNTIVKGCSPATIKIFSAHATGVAQTVHFSFGGTGIHGTDYTSPDSATIAAGDTSVVVSIAGIPTPPGGTKTLELYLLSPFSCGIVDSISLNIMDTPSAHILTPDTTICLGASFMIRVAGTTGLGYSWTPAAGLSSPTVMQPIASPVATTTYVMSATLALSGCPAIVKDVSVTVINTTVTIVTPNTTICIGGTVNLNVTGPPTLNYSWSPAAGLSDPTIQNPIATPTVTTTYTLLTTAAGGLCPTTESVTITVSVLNVAILTPDTTLCRGNSFMIRVSGPSGPTYSWLPAAGLSNASVMEPVASPSVTTTYILSATWPGSGCPDVSDSVKINVIDAIIHLLNPDTILCCGSSINIDVTGSPSLAYSWTPTAGLSDPTSQTPVATPSVTTVYVVTAVSAGNICVSKDTLYVVVGNPAATLLNPDTIICKGSSVHMRVAGNPELTYAWSPIEGLTDPFAMEPIASPTSKTTYMMTATAPGTPCSITNEVTIGVTVASMEHVTVDQVIRYGSSVQLNADSALFYTWAPNDGSLSNPNINNPIARPEAPTTYTVTGIDSHGCISTASVKIDLIYPQMFVPDAFTPNGDGLNDVFRMGSTGYYKLVEMSVFNRWGNMVYHATGSENKGWDGTYNGAPQDIGVYNYFLIASRPDGTLESYKGTVTLIR